MKHRLHISSLLVALAFSAGTAAAAQTPAAAPAAKVETQVSVNATPRAEVKVDAQEARRELDGMREQMRELLKKMAEMSAKLGDVGPRSYAWRYIGDQDRGMIGVVLADDENHTRINAITPGGPAEKAGLHNDDVIVGVHGTGIDARSNDAAKAALRNLKVGQEVTLNVRRDGKVSDIKVTAERREPYNMAYSINVDSEQIRADVARAMQDAQLDKLDAEQIRNDAVEAAKNGAEQGRIAAEQGRIVAMQARAIADQARHQAAQIRYSTPWWGLNLANLNPDLGSYFGANHGALVLSVDAETAKTLKSGDVLLAIDGKKIERPEDAMRLLRESEKGHEIKVEVLRAHKAQTLSMKAPEFKSLFVPAPPLAPLAPLPPAAPAAPAAVAPLAPPAPPAAPTAPPET